MNFNDLTHNMRRILNDALDKVTSKQNLKGIADDLAKDIKKRTSLGKSVDKPKSTPKKLKALKKSTKKARGYAKKMGKLSPNTSPAKSNLTHSGKMLDSIYGKATDKKITIDVGQDRKAVAKHVSKDRPFINPDRGQIREIEKQLEKELAAAVEKALNKL